VSVVSDGVVRLTVAGPPGVATPAERHGDVLVAEGHRLLADSAVAVVGDHPVRPASEADACQGRRSKSRPSISISTSVSASIASRPAASGAARAGRPC
jgi:hypothetical protein